jgi:hypothetical protein
MCPSATNLITRTAASRIRVVGEMVNIYAVIVGYLLYCGG